MRSEYRILAAFAVVLLILLFIFLGWKTAVSFAIGALASAAAGWLGMYSATKANVRTTVAARSDGAPAALSVAFFGGSIMGLCVASLGLVGLGFLYLLFGGDPETAHAIHGFGMGASTVALFSRVGGGIFTKSADVGADLVGKVEAGIPEDDPRNPGVIADNVGDNVGDVAGMGSDIFESYCGSMIATIAIASTLAAATLELLGARESLMFLPLALASTGLICSIAGIFLVKVMSSSKPDVALRSGTIGAAVLFIALAYFVITGVEVNVNVWWAVAVRRGRRHYHRSGHRVLHLGQPGAQNRQSRRNRHRHGDDRRAGGRYAVGGHPGGHHRHHYFCQQRVGRAVRGRHRRHRYAGHGRHHHGH